jgi:hypothetical protein
MKTVSRLVAAASVVLLGLALVLPVPCAQAQQYAAPNAAAEDSLKKFLRTMLEDKDTRYIAAFYDLNGDGVPEAVVYLLSNDSCGSGGCNTLVLARAGDSWRVVTSLTITWPPIRVLQSTANGWHSLEVSVGGGGSRSGYEAELRFNGKSYPRNPSVPPARRSARTAGTVIIPSTQNAKPLF